MARWVALLVVTTTWAACGPRLGAVPPPANVSPPVCSPVPRFGPPIDASYPSGVLKDQQGMVPVVGMDRVEPVDPALEYFARVGIANGANAVTFALT
jgi:hypothetical protein